MRRRDLKARLVASCVLVALSSSTAVAQQEEVGLITRIAERKGEDRDSTERASVVRGITTRPAIKRAPLHNRNIVRLYDRVHLDLSFMDSGSRVILGSETLEAKGSYEIRQGTAERIGDVELVVREGVLVVEYVRSRIVSTAAGGVSDRFWVIAAGIRTWIRGTTVLFEVDPSDSTGFVFLREGQISFPDFQMEGSGTNRAWHLQEGQRPVEIFPGSPLFRSEWRQEVQNSTNSVWKGRSFFTSAKVLIPAAAVTVAAGIVAAVASRQNGPGDAQGSVIITLPD